ncbi:MAG: Fic family protein, partial [Hydrogenophaga sp.]|nr:Fic family protein [Hydrogenophaga sp.]
MSSDPTLLLSIEASENGLTLAELMAQHPKVARRTAQRQIAQLIAAGQIVARGEGRARRYWGIASHGQTAVRTADADVFSHLMPLSADSRDILAYIEQPTQRRKPVGYQRDFLDAYRPNESGYLSEPLRRQLHKMGRTTAVDEPA